MPQWMHDRAEHILAKNPSMPKSEAFAIATQQMHATGKTPKGYGTAEGKREAKAKYTTPKDDKKTANPGHLESEKMSSAFFEECLLIEQEKLAFMSAGKYLLDQVGKPKVRAHNAEPPDPSLRVKEGMFPSPNSPVGQPPKPVMPSPVQAPAPPKPPTPPNVSGQGPKVGGIPNSAGSPSSTSSIKHASLPLYYPGEALEARIGATRKGIDPELAEHVYGQNRNAWGGIKGGLVGGALGLAGGAGLGALAVPEFRPAGAAVGGLLGAGTGAGLGMIAGDALNSAHAHREAMKAAIPSEESLKAAAACLRKTAFADSGFGPTGGVFRPKYESYQGYVPVPSPVMMDPHIKHGGNVPPEGLHEGTEPDIEKKGAIPLTPKGRLSSSMQKGHPKVTAPPGPSSSDISKPVGYGLKLPGATKA